MRSFEEIHEIAAARKGGRDALEQLLQKPKSPEELAATKDDRWLAAMARSIFQAGFSWKVIESKWPGFERAFDGFDPARVAFYHDDDLDRLLADTAIVRNGMKIAAVIENARYVLDLTSEQGSAGTYFGSWPDSNYVGLLQDMSRRGSRLGGNTGQRMLRSMERSSFVLSPDVTARLIEEGVVDKQPTSKGALRSVQDAFNTWQTQSGRSLTGISQVLAYSI